MKRTTRKVNVVLPLLFPVILILYISCNKGFDRVVEQREYIDTTSAVAQSPHVLFILTDGARGTAIRDAEPPHIMDLTTHAIYCWNVVTDTSTDDASTWADLLTAVHSDKHEVAFGQANNLANYPVFFRYIKDRNMDFRILTFSASNALKGLISGVDDNQSFNGDDAATQAAALKAMTEDSADMLVVQFNGVDTVGARYGYGLAVPEYKAAIMQTDTYIGELVSAMKARETYKNENWLVVVASNHGGPFIIPPTEDDHTILSNPIANGFILFANPSFKPNFIDKPYTGNRYIGKAVEFNGVDASAVYATVADDDHDYDFSDTVDFTIEMKIKVMPGPNGDYSYGFPSFFSKRAHFDEGVTGFAMFLEQRFWQINFGQAGQGNTQVAGGDVSDGTWHDIAAVVLNRDGKRFARTYTDGNYNREVEITGKGNINTDAPLTMGFIPGSINTPADLFISDVKIWRKALSDETIGQYACEPGLAADHPATDRLIGYWSGLDGTGDVIQDKATLQHDFVLHGPFQWLDFNDLVCPPPAGDLAKEMPQPVDVPTQILNWLEVPVSPDWDLDGRVWTADYVGLEQ